MERSQSPRGSHHSQDETARLKRISSTDRLHLLRAWNEMDLHFRESSVDYLWLFYTAFYTAKGADRKEQCYIAKLAIWKEKTSFSHEYLVATVKSVHDDNREHYLLFERTVGELNRDGVREEKLDGEAKRRRRRREGIRNLEGVVMPERLWEAHAFGGDAKRQENLSDEEVGNDTWTTTIKGLISDVSESSSANLILADDRYQLLDQPFRKQNDVHIASLYLKKPYEDDDEKEAPKTTDDPVPKSPTAQEANQTEKLPSPVSPQTSENNAHPSVNPQPDVSHSQSPPAQHHIEGRHASPQIQRQYSAESDSSLYDTTSHLDFEPSVLERAVASVPNLTEARLSPHLFASQLSSFDDTSDLESRYPIPFDNESDRFSSSTSSVSSTSSTSSGYSTSLNQSPSTVPGTPELPYANVTPRNQSPTSVRGTPELPYAADVEDSQNTSGEYSNPSPGPHQGTSQHGSLTPVHRNTPSLDHISYAEPEVNHEEIDASKNMDKATKSLLFESHEDAEQSRHPVLELKTIPDASESPVEASGDAPGIQTSPEEPPQLSPLEVDPLSLQHPPADEISTVPRSPGQYFPLGRIPSHASSDSKKSTSSRVSRQSVKSFFSIHSDTVPPMPSRKYVFLFELVALANRLHKCKSLYRLFTKNCYWFVGIMFHVVRNFCQIDVSIDDKEGKPDVMKPEDEVTIWVNSGRMGRFLHAIKIMKAPRLFTIQALKRKWQAANARFVAQLKVNFAESTPEQLTVIQHAVDREKSRRIKWSQHEEEMQRRLDELKKRDEERIEEERRRHAEELKKREEEAKKAVEEEKKRYEEEAKKREEEKKRYEEEKKALLEELMRYRENEMKKAQI